MSRWRTFVRWLARRDISQAFEAGSQAGALMAHASLGIREIVAHAQGECEGMARAFEAVKAAALERNGRELTGEDVERAKRRMLH